MMNVRLIMCGMLLLVVTGSFTARSSAQTRRSVDDGSFRIEDPPPRIAVRRIDSILLVNVDETAKALGWEAKVVLPGKLLTLCRGGDDGVCIPIRLAGIAFRQTSGGMYLEATTVERALQLQFSDEDSGSVAVERAVAKAIGDDEIPAYNANWGPGRGFRVGQTLPDIPLIDLDGREVRFSEFLGKRYIVYCWASW